MEDTPYVVVTSRRRMWEMVQDYNQAYPTKKDFNDWLDQWLVTSYQHNALFPDLGEFFPIMPFSRSGGLHNCLANIYEPWVPLARTLMNINEDLSTREAAKIARKATLLAHKRSLTNRELKP